MGFSNRKILVFQRGRNPCPKIWRSDPSRSPGRGSVLLSTILCYESYLTVFPFLFMFRLPLSLGETLHPTISMGVVPRQLSTKEFWVSGDETIIDDYIWSPCHPVLPVIRWRGLWNTHTHSWFIRLCIFRESYPRPSIFHGQLPPILITLNIYTRRERKEGSSETGKVKTKDTTTRLKVQKGIIKGYSLWNGSRNIHQKQGLHRNMNVRSPEIDQLDLVFHMSQL